MCWFLNLLLVQLKTLQAENSRLLQVAEKYHQLTQTFQEQMAQLVYVDTCVYCCVHVMFIIVSIALFADPFEKPEKTACYSLFALVPIWCIKLVQTYIKWHSVSCGKEWCHPVFLASCLGLLIPMFITWTALFVQNNPKQISWLAKTCRWWKCSHLSPSPILLLSFVAGKCTNSRIQALHVSSCSQHCMVKLTALYTNSEYQLKLFSRLLHLS